MPISRRTHHLPFVRNGFSDSAQNFGLGTTLKPFGLRRLNKSARALGPLSLYQIHYSDNYQHTHVCMLIIIKCFHRNTWPSLPFYRTMVAAILFLVRNP